MWEWARSSNPINHPLNYSMLWLANRIMRPTCSSRAFGSRVGPVSTFREPHSLEPVPFLSHLVYLCLVHRSAPAMKRSADSSADIRVKLLVILQIWLAWNGGNASADRVHLTHPSTNLMPASTAPKTHRKASEKCITDVCISVRMDPARCP